MKELSIEEKAKRYNEAIKIAKDINYEQRAQPFNVMIRVFPELKESEDDKIRKDIVAAVETYGDFTQGRKEEIYTWLEKQGKKHLENYDEAEKEKADFVGDGFIECHADFLDFKEGNTYWLEYMGDDKYNVRSDNLLGKTYHITPCQLYTVFKKLTWIEKQREQKPVTDEVKPKFKVGDVVTNKKSKDTVKIVQILHDSYCYSGWDGAATVHSDFSISEQDNWELVEQKLADKYNIRGIKSKHAEGKLGEMIKEMKSTEKAEPKFHEGDWVLNSVCFPIQIASTEGGMYVFTDGEAISSSFIDENYHLWSIQDAEDGDVLATDGGVCIFDGTLEEGKYPFAYCGITKRGFESYNGNLPFSHDNNIHPATKEQRDTLMKAMTDAGYTFDFEKKELKLLITNGGDFESENCEQNPTWSEEDKKMFVNIKACLRNANKDYIAELDWLKSLKPQKQWKPSEEQIKALNYVINLMASSESQKENDYYYNVFKGLREQLKKL